MYYDVKGLQKLSYYNKSTLYGQLLKGTSTNISSKCVFFLFMVKYMLHAFMFIMIKLLQKKFWLLQCHLTPLMGGFMQNTVRVLYPLFMRESPGQFFFHLRRIPTLSALSRQNLFLFSHSAVPSSSYAPLPSTVL